MAVRAGSAYVQVDADFNQYNRQVHEHLGKRLTQDVHVRVHTESFAKLGDAIKTGVTAAAGLATAGVAAMSAEVVRATQRWADHEAVVRRTSAVIKSTGEAARVTAGHVDSLSQSIEKKTGIDNDQIQASANLLLTFTNIRNEVGKNNDIFDRATSTTINMSKALGEDANSAAIQLGKALNDPIRGITALQRVGVSFNQQQRDQIKTLVQSGKTLEAQKIILHELNKEFPRVDPTPFEKLRSTGRDLEDTIGKHVLPIFNKFVDEVQPKLQKIVDTSGKIFDDKSLNLGEKITKIGHVIRRQLGPLAQQVEDGLKQAHLDDKLAEAINWAAPKVLAAVGMTGVRAADTFWKAFRDAPLWEQVAGGAWLAHKLGLDKGAFKLLTTLLSSRGVGGGAGLLSRGATPLDPMYVFVVNGGGGGNFLKDLEKDAGKGGETSLLTRLKTFLRGSPESPAGFAESFAKLAQKSPIRAAALPAIGISAFVGAAHADNTPVKKIEGALQAADPTQGLNLIGLPSVTQLLFGDTSAQRKSLQRVVSGHPMTQGWQNTSLGARGGPAPVQQSASVKQATKDWLAMNTQLAKLETHQQSIKTTAFNLDWLAKQAKKVGDVKWAFADRLGAEMVRARGATSRGITQVLREFTKLPPAARTQAQQSMVMMARGMESSGEVPKGTLAKIVSQIVGQYADMEKKSKRSGDQMMGDLLNSIRLIGQKGIPTNEKTKETILGQFDDLRKKGGTKFSGIKNDAITAFLDMQAGIIPTGSNTASALYEAFKAMGVNADELAQALGIKPITLKLTQHQQDIMRYNKAKQAQLIRMGVAGGGLFQVGQPGARGFDTIPMNVGGQPIMVGSGEQVAVLNRHQQGFLNAMLAPMGGLSGMFGKIKTPHYMAGGGLLSYGQLEGLWTQAGGDPKIASLMAAIALAESGGNPSIVNSIGASGLWQIHPAMPGDLDPLQNARYAVMKYRTQGLQAWEAYTNGSYRQFLHGGVPAVGGFGAPPVIGRVIVEGPPGAAHDLAQGGADKGRKEINDYLKSHMPAIVAGVVGAPGGPVGVGTFQGIQVANWVIAALRHAQGKGVNFQITSGYRPGFDPHTATGSSEHQGTQYPHGAVDFGGYVDPHAFAEKMAVVGATADFKWPLLAPIGFRDDGHASGTGHALGGFINAASGYHSPDSFLKGLFGNRKASTPWWRRVSKILNAIGKVKYDKKGKAIKPNLDALHKLEKTVKRLGLIDPTAEANKVTADTALADAAGQLIDTDKISRALLSDQSWQDPKLYPPNWDSSTMDLPPAAVEKQKTIIEGILDTFKVRGKTQLGWLVQQLSDQAAWRGKLIRLHNQIVAELKRRRHALEVARKRVKRLTEKPHGLIPTAEAQIKKINDKLHPKVAKGHKAPSLSKAERKKLNDDLDRAKAQLGAYQTELTGLTAQDTGLIPILNTAIGNLNDAEGGEFTGSGALGSLYQLQGPVDTKNRFRFLGVNAAGVLQREGPSVWFGDIGSVLSTISGYDKQYFQQPTFPTTTEGAGPVDQAALDLQRLGVEREAVQALQTIALRSIGPTIPFGGSFADGGTVPGPPGAARVVIAHGGEVITPEDRVGGDTHVYIDGKGVSLNDLIDVRIEQRTRNQARTGIRASRLAGTGRTR